MTATDRLDAMQQRCDAATEGPWETWYTMGYATWPIVGRYGVGAIFDSIDHGIRDEDAQFAANARTDLPATIAALRAVLDLCDRGESTADELLLLDLSAAEWGGAHAARNAYGAVRAAIEGALT